MRAPPREPAVLPSVAAVDSLLVSLWFVCPVGGPVAVVTYLVWRNGQKREAGEPPMSGCGIALLALLSAFLGLAFAFASCVAFISMPSFH